MDFDAALVADGVSESDEAFGGPGDAAVEEDVGVADDAVFGEAAGGGDLGAVVADLQDALVVFGALGVAHLSRLGDGGLDVAGVPGACGADEASVFAVFVEEEFDVVALDGALESFAFGDGDGVEHVAFADDVADFEFFAEDAFSVGDLVLDGAAADFDFGDLGGFFGDAGDEFGLGVGDDADFFGVGGDLFWSLGFFLRHGDASVEFWFEVVCPGFVGDVEAVGVALVGADGGDSHRGGFDDGDGDFDFAAAGGAGGSVVDDEGVGHAGFVSEEGLEFGFVAALDPALDVGGLAGGAFAGPVSMGASFWMVDVWHNVSSAVSWKTEVSFGFLLWCVSLTVTCPPRPKK